MPKMPSHKRKSLKQRLACIIKTHYQIAAALIIGTYQMAIWSAIVFFIFLFILYTIA